tara:strand:+ start:385 stop:696 length:312 start_codon:yes stop_codon:yes gene_type:complete
MKVLMIFKEGIYMSTVEDLAMAKRYILTRGYHLSEREYEVIAIDDKTLRVGVLTNDSYGWCKDTVEDWTYEEIYLGSWQMQTSDPTSCESSRDIANKNVCLIK